MGLMLRIAAIDLVGAMTGGYTQLIGVGFLRESFETNNAENPSSIRFTSFSGRLTQRLECHPHTVEVVGSNPTPPIPKPLSSMGLRFRTSVTHGVAPLFDIPCDRSVGKTVG
jgi:hypothetical protein